MKSDQISYLQNQDIGLCGFLMQVILSSHSLYVFFYYENQNLKEIVYKKKLKTCRLNGVNTILTEKYIIFIASVYGSACGLMQR